MGSRPRGRSRRIAVIVALSAFVVAGAALAWVRRWTPPPLAPDLEAAEAALASRERMVGLARAHVAGWVALSDVLHGEPRAEDAPAEEGSFQAELARAGLDLRRDLDAAAAAIYLDPGPDGSLDYSWVAAFVGRFEPQEVADALGRVGSVEIEALPEAGRGHAYRVRQLEPYYCGERGPFELWLAPGRAVLGSEGPAGEIFARWKAGGGDLEGPALARYRELPRDRLVALRLVVPDESFAPAGLVRRAEEQARQELTGVREVLASLAVDPIWRRFALDLAIVGPDATTARARAEDWRGRLAASRARWEKSLPAAARLHDGLKLGAEGDATQVGVYVDPDLLGALRELPGQVLAQIFETTPSREAAAFDAESEIDPNAPLFDDARARLPLPPFDPQVPFAEESDRVVGPFGLRVEALGLAQPDGRGLPASDRELATIGVTAFGTGLPELGSDDAERGTLRVLRVEDASGRDLLREEACGAQRNESAVKLSRVSVGGDGVWKAEKTVRLTPGVSHGEVAQLTGDVEVQIPVRTESLRLEKPGVVRRAGVQVEVTRLEGAFFGYRLSGDTGRVLALRGLDDEGRPLLGRGSTRMGTPGDGAVSGSREFQGRVAAVEAVLALERERRRFPFTLTPVQPTPWATTVETDSAGPQTVFSAPARTLLRGAPPPPHADDAPLAETTSGPLRIALRRVEWFGKLFPEIRLRAPDLAALKNGVGRVAVAIERIVGERGAPLAPDPAHAVGLRAEAELSAYWKEQGLRADVSFPLESDVDPAAVRALEGEVRVRVARETIPISFSSVLPGAAARHGDLELRIRERDRHGVELAIVGDAGRIVEAHAFDAEGRALRSAAKLAAGEEADAALRIDVQGAPARLVVDVATRQEQVSFPFALGVPAPESP